MPDDWPALRARMLAPKPALRCTGYAIGKDPTAVRYDGAGGFTNPDGGPIEGEAWLTSAVEPSRFAALAAADGTIVGTEWVGSRTATIAEVAGLRGGKASFLVWVDDEVGCILRIERTDDPAPLVILDGLELDRGTLRTPGRRGSRRRRSRP
jgi:hypothetical protein